MAQPRFTGHGFTNPLNPLSLHAENRYREPMPVMGDFQRYEAETRVFEAGVGRLLRELIEQIAKESVQAMAKAAVRGGKVADEIMKQVAKEVETAIKKAGDDAAKRAAKLGKSVEDQAKAAMKAMDGAIDDVALEGADDAAKVSIRTAGKKSVSEGMEAGMESSLKGRGFKQFMKTTGVKAGGLGAIGVGAGYVLLQVFGTDGLVSEWLDNMMGGNCDEKAEDIGHFEGTDEYKKSVKDCHKRAESKMAMLGGFAILVVGGVVFLIIR